MSKVFNITITPTDTPKLKELGGDTKGFTITILNLIELSGKVFQDTRYEMVATDVVSKTNLGNINGKLDDTIILNFNAPNAAGTFLEGKVNFYLWEEKALYLKYELKGIIEIKDEVQLFYL
ncbi:hypothetical protein RhiirA5_350996 [Rhizophagus irregularis]|uniref:Uncharacterized protein n=1 Tax=Rhizophagus irregularis TaxID=588596 RepID=A0A2I1EHN0_9GLOM|nr:hypothetical protein RhiirA5_350996 [Rhizophagus irregularis]PKC71555.1 hypothetical protein RhiirA1_413036 [Rhizophagus irregularis]PKK74123.1 hypothetical protein RhiirC2_739463 [Rhizophagus irregularis]PKY21627.1 hypothetical protein RhiirB3_409683 [Rhizophagus irregularis]CAB4389375.1 unnamed protein product [Rhizophagus irregularis]